MISKKMSDAAPSDPTEVPLDASLPHCWLAAGAGGACLISHCLHSNFLFKQGPTGQRPVQHAEKQLVCPRKDSLGDAVLLTQKENLI